MALLCVHAWHKFCSMLLLLLLHLSCSYERDIRSHMLLPNLPTCVWIPSPTQRTLCLKARWHAGNLMVVALADMAGLQKVASFTLNNLFQPGDTIHTTFVEDTANSGRLPVSDPPSPASCVKVTEHLQGRGGGEGGVPLVPTQFQCIHQMLWS